MRHPLRLRFFVLAALASLAIQGCIKSTSVSSSAEAVAATMVPATPVPMDTWVCTPAVRDVRCDGALGDGATDNSAAFASTYASGASKIHIPAGAWKGHFPVIARGVYFYGDGPTATSFIGDPSGAPIFDVTGEAYTIQDLGFWGNPNISVKLESGAHLGHLSNLLCRSSPATFVYDVDAWDMQWDDLVAISCGGPGSALEGGTIVLNGTNNIVINKPTLEGVPNSGIVVVASGDITVIGGKVDNSWAVTAVNGAVNIADSDVSMSAFSMQGSFGYELILTGGYLFSGAQLYFGGGTTKANVYFAPSWRQHIDANPHPATGAFSCSQCRFESTHPSVSTSTPAAFEGVTPSIVRRQAGAMSAFGAESGGPVDFSSVAIALTMQSNDLYDDNYLVEAAQGDSVRAKIATSFSGSNLDLYGMYSSPDLRPGAGSLHFIEWDANPYPHLSLEQTSFEGGTPIFLAVAEVTLTATASFDATTGYTSLSTDYRATDLTGTWLLDPVTSRPFHIESHDRTTGVVTLAYDQRRFFSVAAKYQVYAGALIDPQLLGASVTWSADDTIRSVPVETLQQSGRSTTEVFPWGEGTVSP